MTTETQTEKKPVKIQKRHFQIFTSDYDCLHLMFGNKPYLGSGIKNSKQFVICEGTVRKYEEAGYLEERKTNHFYPTEKGFEYVESVLMIQYLTKLTKGNWTSLTPIMVKRITEHVKENMSGFYLKQKNGYGTIYHKLVKKEQ